ncbi:Solute carrier family 25 member 1 [Balamuthia mandrillaris]
MSEKKQPKKITAKEVVTNSVSGGVSGALEIMFTFPFEFAKTQIQLNPHKYKTTWGCWKLTTQQYGFTALYRGMPPLIVFGIPRNAARFTAAEYTKSIMDIYAPDMGLVPQNIIGGFVGGFSEAVLVTTYQETMKVRLIHDRLSEKPRFRNTFHGITTILREQGFSGVYKGLTATIIKQGSNQAIRFPVYYYLKNQILGDPKADFSKNGVVWGNIQGLFVGAVAGAASVVGNTPIDVIKTKMQGFESQRYGGMGNTIRLIWKEEGFMGFYKGMGARLGRVSADVALTFLFMEQVKVMLKKLW